MLTDINRLLFRFLWRKKDCNRKAFKKVKRVVMCNDFGNGALKMIDLKQMQMSLLLLWVVRLPSTNLGEMGMDSQNIIYVLGVQV